MPRRYTSRVGRFVLCLFLACTSACRTWQPLPVRPTPDPLPDRLLVILWDGYRHTLENPRIELDSMRSDEKPPIALQDIGAMEHMTISWGDTLVLIGGIVGVVGAVAMTFVLDGLSSSR